MTQTNESPEYPGRFNSSKSRDIVLDPFGGSGTTLIAAEKSGRQARLMELDPKYCDVICRRFQNYTEQEAKRASDGAKFEELVVDLVATL